MNKNIVVFDEDGHEGTFVVTNPPDEDIIVSCRDKSGKPKPVSSRIQRSTNENNETSVVVLVEAQSGRFDEGDRLIIIG